MRNTALVLAVGMSLFGMSLGIASIIMTVMSMVQGCR